MKSKRAYLALPLALLGAALVLACENSRPTPVGPEGLGPQFTHNDPEKVHGGPKGGGNGGDGGGSKTALVDLQLGMQTAGLDVTVNQDSPKKLHVGNSDFVHDIQMNFINPGVCVGIKATNGSQFPTAEEFDALVAELTASVGSGFFTMQIDKADLVVGGFSTSDDHLLIVEFEGTLGSTRILLGSPFDQVDPATVKWTSQDVFEFTGPVVVWAHGVGDGGGEKSNRIIACPGVGLDPNKVVATLTR